MQRSSLRVVVNACLFQAGWWACVVGAARGYAWLGVSVVAVVTLLHFAFVSNSRKIDLLLPCCAFVVGLLADTAVAAAGAVTFGTLAWAVPLAPPFMLALWVNLALTVTTMLRWLRRRYVLAALFGAVGGPLAYYTGAQLGAITLGPLNVPLALLIIAVEWLVAMPLLVLIWELLDTSSSPVA